MGNERSRPRHGYLTEAIWSRGLRICTTVCFIIPLFIVVNGLYEMKACVYWSVVALSALPEPRLSLLPEEQNVNKVYFSDHTVRACCTFVCPVVKQNSGFSIVKVYTRAYITPKSNTATLRPILSFLTPLQPGREKYSLRYYSTFLPVEESSCSIAG